MLESIEKLRELRGAVEAKDVDNPIWVCHKAEIIADEIEREISERYMLLPVDADGVPIRVGDNITYSDSEFTVRSIGDEYVHAGGIDMFAHAIHHVKPHTVEDVLVEFYGEFAKSKYGEDSEVLSHYADKLHDLLDGDAS